ncbi:MAG: tetratricopeptide repeat protein [Planctomycetota bacterium]
MSNMDDALRLLKQEEAICRQMKNLDGLQRNLGNQALIHRDTATKVLEELQEFNTVAHNVRQFVSLDNALVQPFSILLSHHLENAIQLLQEQADLCGKLEKEADLLTSLGNQATALQLLGKFDESLLLHKEVAAMCRKSNNIQDLTVSLFNQAEILAFQMGKGREALPLAEEAHRLARESGLTALAQQVKPILDEICAQAR